MSKDPAGGRSGDRALEAVSPLTKSLARNAAEATGSGCPSVTDEGIASTCTGAGLIVNVLVTGVATDTLVLSPGWLAGCDDARPRTVMWINVIELTVHSPVGFE